MVAEAKITAIDLEVNVYVVKYNEAKLKEAGYTDIKEYTKDKYKGNPWLGIGDGVIREIDYRETLDRLGVDKDSIEFI